MAQERLQKLIAQAGVASRRAAEALITEGRVRVNGRVVTQLGAKADPVNDRIDVDGKRIVSEKPAYYLLHKPRGVVTTLDDPEGRDTIITLLKGVPERVFPVGRLDYHTSGVLLVTNDGAMAQALLHPNKTVPKTYVAKVRGHLDVPQLDALRNGVHIGGGETTRKAEVFVLREERNNTWLQVTITEGKNRQVHRMIEAVGSRVGRLARVAFAGLTLEGLRPGEYREVTSNEMQKLKRDYLNPQKRAIAAAVRKEALDTAMFALGFNPDREDDDEGDFDDEGEVPRASPRKAGPPRRAPQAGPREGRGPRREGGPRAGQRDSGRPQRSVSERPRPTGPAVEVVTVRRRSTMPPADFSAAPSPAVPRAPRAPELQSRARKEAPTPAPEPEKRRAVRKVVTPRHVEPEPPPPKKKAAKRAASKSATPRRKKA